MTLHAPRFTSIPEDRAEVIEVETAPGITLLAYRIRKGPDTGPAILFGHANGLAAGSYLPLLELLSERAQVFAFDSRGHGGSSVPLDDLPRDYSRSAMVEDMVEVIKAVRARIGEAPLYYAGHSKCAVEALHLGVAFGRHPWRAVTLFEPPLLPPKGHPLRPVIGDAPPPIIDMSRRRRPRWPSPEALARSLAKRPVFAHCLPEMLAAHCRATLRPIRPGEDGGPGEGDYTLCCPPAVEAQVFITHTHPSNFEAVARFPGPLTLVGAEPDEAAPGDWLPAALAAAAQTNPGCRYIPMRGVSHMLLLEAPELCANVILEMFG